VTKSVGFCLPFSWARLFACSDIFVAGALTCKHSLNSWCEERQWTVNNKIRDLSITGLKVLRGRRFHQPHPWSCSCKRCSRDILQWLACVSGCMITVNLDVVCTWSSLCGLWYFETQTTGYCSILNSCKMHVTTNLSLLPSARRRGSV